MKNIKWPSSIAGLSAPLASSLVVYKPDPIQHSSERHKSFFSSSRSSPVSDSLFSRVFCHVGATPLSRSGITVSTIPAIFIRIYQAKRDVTREEESVSVDDEICSDPLLTAQLRSLPKPRCLRVRSHIILIVVILCTCVLIHLIAFVAMGFWLKYQYTPTQLLESNSSIDPFYAASIIVITGFNQNGLSPW